MTIEKNRKQVNETHHRGQYTQAEVKAAIETLEAIKRNRPLKPPGMVRK